jgi:hypothetical protein
MSVDGANLRLQPKPAFARFPPVHALKIAFWSSCAIASEDRSVRYLREPAGVDVKRTLQTATVDAPFENKARAQSMTRGRPEWESLPPFRCERRAGLTGVRQDPQSARG